MGVEVIYWLLAVIAVGVIVVMAIGIRGASKDSSDYGDTDRTPPPVATPMAGSASVTPPSGGPVPKPVTPVISNHRKETKKPVPVQTGPQPVTIYQFPLESVTCVCPKCDGENNPAHRFCWICGQRIS